MKKEIAWEYWENPFVTGPVHPDEDGDLEVDDSVQLIPVITTTKGLVPVEDTSEGQVEFLVGHTNFNLLPKHEILIGSVPGVEFIKILSRYKFKILVAQLFNDDAVKRDIEDVILEDEVYDRDGVYQLISKKRRLRALDENLLKSYGEAVENAKNKKPYVVALWPDGTIQTSFDEKDVISIAEACNICGGITEVAV